MRAYCAFPPDAGNSHHHAVPELRTPFSYRNPALLFARIVNDTALAKTRNDLDFNSRELVDRKGKYHLTVLCQCFGIQL